MVEPPYSGVMRYFLAMLLPLLCFSAPAAGQDELAARLARAAAVEAAPARIRDSLVAPQWLPAGDRLIVWNAVGRHAGTWLLVDAEGRTQRPVIARDTLQARLATLTGEAAQVPDQLRFVVAPGGDAILFAYRDLPYRLDLATGTIARITQGGLEALILDGAIPSPRGDLVAVQRDAGVAVVDRSGNTVFERAGTADASWRLPERAWSANGRLALWLDDRRHVHHIPVIDYSATTERVTMVPYPKFGTPLARERLYLVDVAKGTAIPARLPDQEGYAWLAGWQGADALVLYLSRDGKRLDLLAAARDGAARNLIREEHRATKVADLNFAAGDWRWQVVPLSRDRGFLWLSERDGWRHVFHHDATGRLVRQVTRGAFPVIRVDAVGADDAILVTASTDAAAPYDERLYRTDLTGGALRPVAVQPGVHHVIASPSGRWLVDGHSFWTVPRTRTLMRIDGSARRHLTTADVRDEAGSRPAPQALLLLAADGVTQLHGALCRPAGFDPARRYPVIAYIYGGPFGTVVARSYVGTSMSLRAQALAAAGFVVIAIDVRGSAGRSRAFKDATQGRVGQTEIADYVAGLGQVAATRPWMDMARVGIHGHSWGGYFTIRAMLTAPDAFVAGYAGAPGALDEDALVNEPNMGLIADNPTGYAAGSNPALAGRLNGALRIMHGTADTSAPLSSTMRMTEALIAADKPVDLLIMPGVDHDPAGPAGDYYRNDVIRFFIRTLGVDRAR